MPQSASKANVFGRISDHNDCIQKGLVRDAGSNELKSNANLTGFPAMGKNNKIRKDFHAFSNVLASDDDLEKFFRNRRGHT